MESKALELLHLCLIISRLYCQQRLLHLLQVLASVFRTSRALRPQDLNNIANWNSDDDTTVEQSEATSDAWTPTSVVTPHSKEAGDIEYDADWAENVSIRLRHHVLEEGIAEHPWEHYSEEDFFN